jgi:thiol-disulfide isomerase/thioredoxin
MLACAASVDAASSMNVEAGGIRLGGHVSGPVVSPETLANRVVLLEFWGLNCGPCIASMPKLEELHRTLGPQGLVVIGAHAQGGTVEDIRAGVAKLGITFAVVDGGRVEGADDIEGIPHCMLFDHTGKCVFRGHPASAHDAVEAAMKAAPGAVLEGRVLVKIPELNTLLQDEGKFATGLKKAKSLMASDDTETAAEATYVVERIEAYGRRMLDEAMSAKRADPVKALDLLQRCLVILKGSVVGDEATKLKSEWMKDKQLQATVKASHQIIKLEEMQAKVRQQLGLGPRERVTEEMAATIPSAVKGRVRVIAESIVKATPESPLAAKAVGIAAELGVLIGS